MKWILAWIFVGSVSAHAQDYLSGYKTDLPMPRSESLVPSQKGAQTTALDPKYEKLAQVLAHQMDQKYQELLAGSTLNVSDCQNPQQALQKVRGVRNEGLFQSCIDLARSCQGQLMPEAQLVLLEGASCAHQVLKISEAYELLEAATVPAFASSPYQDLAVYRWALFARNTQYENQIEAILQRHVSWTEKDRQQVRAILELMNVGHADGYSEDSLRQVLFSWMAKNSEWANEITIAWMGHLVWNKYDEKGGLQFIETYFKNVFEVDRVYRYIFQAFYRLAGENFKLADKTLQVYYQHSSPYSWFPVEQNIYTVTEQYDRVCKSSLSQGKDYQELAALKNQWLSGKTPQDILPQVDILDGRLPNKADILTFRGSLLTSMGMADAAFEDYWQAHQLCNYYHRSHWGLHGYKRDKMYQALDDYKEIRDKVDKEVQEGVFPNSLEQYVMNWKALSPAEVVSVKYAIKLFAPFVDGLVEAGTHLYIKRDFEFHSEIPGYESDRDERAWAPDNRSLDELRGRGGNPVVSDIGETLRTPHGDYNLASHEIAHSWHLDYLPAAGRGDLQTCITKLYVASQKRGLFADPYAASHENEYFGQSVSYYLIPVGAPGRYGLTSEWVMKYDPDMFKLIQMIEGSKGDMSKISCPI